MWKAEKQRNEKYTIIKKNMFIGNSQNDQKQEKERICVKLSIFCVRACVRGYFNSPMFGERIMCVSYVSIGNKLENSALSKSALSYRNNIILNSARPQCVRLFVVFARRIQTTLQPTSNITIFHFRFNKHLRFRRINVETWISCGISFMENVKNGHGHSNRWPDTCLCDGIYQKYLRKLMLTAQAINHIRQKARARPKITNKE